jgi:hypothetical protein
MRKSERGGVSDDADGVAGPVGSQAAQRHYDPDGTEELTTAIVYAVADAEDRPAGELRSPPLYESVDAAALERTFFGPDVAGESRQGVGTVEFRYAGYLVTVRSDGWIRVHEPVGPDA